MLVSAVVRDAAITPHWLVMKRQQLKRGHVPKTNMSPLCRFNVALTYFAFFFFFTQHPEPVTLFFYFSYFPPIGRMKHFSQPVPNTQRPMHNAAFLQKIHLAVTFSFIYKFVNFVSFFFVRDGFHDGYRQAVRIYPCTFANRQPALPQHDLSMTA
jgi:hypothetical protein